MKYDWATQDLFTTDKDWEEEFEKVKGLISFGEFKGKLGDKNQFLLCQKKLETVGKAVEKLALYASLKHDENTKISVYDAMHAKVYSLYTLYETESAYIVPEITSLKTEVLEKYIVDKDLSDYDYMLKCVIKEKEHVLSESEENLLAQTSETASSFRDIFSKIDNADLPLPKVRVGLKKIKLTHGYYGLLLQSRNRSIRKRVFKNYYKSYISLINTVSATYYGSVKKDVFYSKARKYDSSIQAALSEEDVPETVYKNLLESVNGALPVLHRYIEEKKKALGYKEMHMYDVYVPTVKNADIKLDYDSAYKLVIKGLSVLGKDYTDLLEKAYKESWLDVYEKDGKRSGAYSNSAYGCHPYVLLNYKPITHDVFTIAHEMGHSIHSYYSDKTQPYAKAGYKIFVAEVASTVNEVLLINYLIDNEKDNKLKKFLLSYLLEMIRTTLFRQTQFAEFEEFTHKTVESGQPLTKDNMSEKYLELNKKYYGKAIISDEEIKYEWARIPHFYTSFYVYKYATGIISALSIVDRILNEKGAVEDYIKFLSSGGSNGPVELLKIAGVDLTSKKPYESAFKVFEEALNKFIAIK